MSKQDASDPHAGTNETAATDAEDGSAANAGEESTQAADADTEQAGEAAEETAPDEDLVDRVAESDPETIATELAALREQVDDLESELDETEAERDELTEKLKRKQAEFQNYKKRMDKRREEEKQRATEDLVTRLLDVRDNLQRALEQDEDADIRGGVESTLRSFDDVLDQENVDVVEPEPGEEVDPHRHEVLVTVESDQPEGAIAEVHRPGYVMAGKVIREAQVTVSDGSGE